jgi:sec-independent protein translocase protein TatA
VAWPRRRPDNHGPTIRSTPRQGQMFEGILQPTHLILILAIALVIFGPGKLSDLGSSLGKSLKDFKKAMNEDEPAATTSQPTTQTTARPQVQVSAGEPASQPEANHSSTTVEAPRS